jgi:hypothetical protein
MGGETYVELELHGPSEQALGFIEGFRAAAGHPGPLWYSDREPLDLGGFVETLREKMHVDTHVIMPAGLARQLEEVITGSGLLAIEVASIREIDYAELGFEFKCFSKDDASGIRAVIEEHLPGDVRLESYDVNTDEREDGKGVELYSPVHHYVCSGQGRYVGPVPDIFELAHRLADQDFIHPGKIRLHHIA